MHLPLPISSVRSNMHEIQKHSYVPAIAASKHVYVLEVAGKLECSFDSRMHHLLEVLLAQHDYVCAEAAIKPAAFEMILDVG